MPARWQVKCAGKDELLLTFKQRTNHYEGDYTLKVMALVGSAEYLIQEWVNPDFALSPQEWEFSLTASEHGVGAANLRIAWVFSGNSANIDQWLIDDIRLAEKEIVPITLNPPQNLIVTIGTGGVALSWNAVSLATGYKIYSAATPTQSPENWNLEATVTGLSWSAPLVDNLRFYKVIAIKEEPTRDK